MQVILEVVAKTYEYEYCMISRFEPGTRYEYVCSKYYIFYFSTMMIYPVSTAVVKATTTPQTKPDHRKANQMAFQIVNPQQCKRLVSNSQLLRYFGRAR